MNNLEDVLNAENKKNLKKKVAKTLRWSYNGNVKWYKIYYICSWFWNCPVLEISFTYSPIKILFPFYLNFERSTFKNEGF